MKSIKTRVLIITSLILLGLLSVYSQDKQMPIEQNDIGKLNKRITKLFDKSNCEDLEGVRLINIFFVVYSGGINKNDFINGNFEQNVKPSYFSNKSRKYLKTESFICKEDGELLALSDGRHIYCLSDYKASAYAGTKKLVSKIIELDLKVVYYISLTPLKTYFGIDKKGKVYLIQVNDEKLNTSLVEEFSDKDWSELFRK